MNTLKAVCTSVDDMIQSVIAHEGADVADMADILYMAKLGANSFADQHGRIILLSYATFVASRWAKDHDLSDEQVKSAIDWSDRMFSMVERSARGELE